jgi:outer membrane receptor for ferrienterochelin and colicins
MFSTLSSAKISGIIIDQKTSRPISDVEITISKTKIGTTSNAEGLFEISNNKREKLILIFNHIAYETKYHPINRIDTSLVIKLKETLLQMDDIVVTSMRSGYLLRDVPVSTEVIGKKEIQSSGAVTINDLLSQRSGVSSSVNVDGGSIFNLLGLDSRYILILKNGQPITGRFNNRVDLNHISVNRIKKIEITKGPGSALYGTDAMGGIINIITDDTNERKTINLNYRATSFGSNLEEISKEPVNDIYSSSIVVPINNFKIYNDVTYQNFSKGQQFEYIKSTKTRLTIFRLYQARCDR